MVGKVRGGGGAPKAFESRLIFGGAGPLLASLIERSTTPTLRMRFAQTINA